MNATWLLFNPNIPKVISFRNCIAEHSIIDVKPLVVVLDKSREGLEFDFMKLHPKKSISQINDIKEIDRMFLVLVINDGPWFYLACKCNHFVTLQSTVHFCKSCRVPVLQVSLRFKVNVEVAYDTNTTLFILFDRDTNLLIKKTCEELLTQSLEKMLFKVETKVQ